MRKISISFIAAYSMLVTPLVLAQTTTDPSQQERRDKPVFVNETAPGESLRAITQGRYCGPMRTSPDNPLLKDVPVAGLWDDEEWPFTSSLQIAIPANRLKEIAMELPADKEQLKKAIDRVAKELTRIGQKINAGELSRDQLMDEETGGKTTCVPLSSIQGRHRFMPVYG
jgi:hypothetical protein